MSVNVNRGPTAPGGARGAGAEAEASTDEGRGDATPAVRAQVLDRCGGDAIAAEEVLRTLNAGQRRGLRVLPDPLPLTSSIAAHAERWLQDRDDLPLLLLASLTNDDRLDTMQQASGRGIRTWQRISGASVCAISAGHVYVDPHIRIWARAQATEAERRQAHRALAVAFAADGDAERTLWHRVRGRADGARAHGEELIKAAAARNARGDADLAFRFADEAAQNGDAAVRRRAVIIGGLAALSGGWLDDALDLLEPVVVAGEVEQRREALGAFLTATAMRRGVLPTIGAVRALCGEEPQARIAGITAVLCAERGARSAARAWLFHARQHVDGNGVVDDHQGTVFASWCAILGGEDDENTALLGTNVGTAPPGPFAAIAAALRAGFDGDHERGLRIVVAAQSPIECGSDPLLARTGRGPLLLAYLALVEALLLTWAGRLRAAYLRLESAAQRGPVTLPFAGLAVVLARRLELAIDGCQGRLSDLLATEEGGASADRHLDRAIEAYLHGRPDDAAAYLRLWADRGAPAPSLGLPGLDEVGPVSAEEPTGPIDARRAAALRRRIRTSGDAGWAAEHQTFAEASRAIVSPFERGRVESLLGTWCLSRGERCDGERHLTIAVALFEDAGADAWLSATRHRLERAAEASDPAEEDDVLVVCHGLWEPLLTAREIEVALRIADGRTNRQIAECLHLSVRTVEVYVGRLFAKLDVRSRAELIALAHRTAFHS